jgi:hypothetical protein
VAWAMGSRGGGVLAEDTAEPEQKGGPVTGGEEEKGFKSKSRGEGGAENRGQQSRSEGPTQTVGMDRRATGGRASGGRGGEWIGAGIDKGLYTPRPFQR